MQDYRDSLHRQCVDKMHQHTILGGSYLGEIAIQGGSIGSTQVRFMIWLDQSERLGLLKLGKKLRFVGL